MGGNRKTKVLFLLCSLLVIISTGCESGHRIYDVYIHGRGEKSLDEMAILSLYNIKDKIRSIDEISLNDLDRLRKPQPLEKGYPVSCIFLSGGKHKVVFGHKRFESDWKGDRIRYVSPKNTWEYNLEKGHVYVVEPKITGYNRFRTYNPNVKWEPILVDKGTIKQLLAESPDSNWFKGILQSVNYMSDLEAEDGDYK